MSKRGEKFRRKGTDLLGHMVAVGRSMFKERLGIDDELATEIARDYAHSLAQHFGGQLFYFPKDMALTLSRRDQRIWEAFNGSNHDDLARRFNLSVQYVYVVLERVRRTETARRQGRLFEVDDIA